MKAVLVSFLIILCGFSEAQEYPNKEIDVSQIADELYGVPDLDLNYEELYENLLQLAASPLNLNKATAEDLRFTNILTEPQVNNLIKYRLENGNFISVYELQAIPGFDLQTIYRLIPFVRVNSPTSSLDASVLKRVRNESDNYFLFRYERTIQTKKGFEPGADTSKFLGAPDRLYLRFRSSRSGDFSIGFTSEKDAGEKLRWSPSTRQYGLDYNSCHLQLQNKGRLKNLVLGDYQSQFGQGLMVGGIFGMGKGGETITAVRRSNIGLLPYTSVYEAGAMRGLGFTVEATDHFILTGFYSAVRKDATLAVDNEDDASISSFQTTGLHRNQKELETRKKILERNIGAVLQYKRRALDAGIMLSQTNFDSPINRSASAYNQFTFEGRKNQNAGVFLNYTFQNLAFFSEMSRTIQGGYASIAGILCGLSPKFDLSILYRKFDRNFNAFYSSGFAESTNTQNETGLYWGWKYNFNRRFSTAGYADFFEFPWLRFRSYSPSTGYEWLLRVNYEPSRKVKIFIQAREENKSRNIETDVVNLYTVAQGKKNNYWVSIDCSSADMFRFKSRVQLSTYTINKKLTHGFAVMQDIVVDVSKIKFTARYALFETEDYDNRQYAYENDVFLAYSLPAYFGSGVRKMIMIQYKVNKHISFWIRYAHTRYRNQEFIGTGADGINGDKKTDIKFQTLIRF
jgi:hypothetical protein